MPYIFPKRYLRSRDVLDPEDLNEDFSPAQELIDGHLDRMNLDAASFKSDVTVAAGAYFTPYYEAVEQDVSFGGDGGAANVATPNFVYVDGTTFRTHWPEDEGTKIYVVPNSGSWEAIDDGSGGSFAVTATTGGSVLWITAYVQYVWQGFFELTQDQGGSTETDEDDTYSTDKWPSDTNKWSYPAFEGSASFERQYPNQGGWHHRSRGARAAKIQFAVRVDGRVITSTITGKDELNEGAPTGMKAGFNKAMTKGQRSLQEKVSYDKSEAIPGQRIPIVPTPGLGPEVMPVRFGAAVPVAPGEHTIEIVARRLPNTARGIPRSRGDFVGVFTRRLLCLDLPNMPPHSDGRPDIKTIPDFDTEQVLDSTLLHDQTAKRLRTRFNNIKRNDIFRHSIPNTHLPSKVQYVKRVSIQPNMETKGDGEGEEEWSLGRCSARWPGWPGGTTTSSAGTRNSVDHVVTDYRAGWDQTFRDDTLGAGWFQLNRNGSDTTSAALEISEPGGDLNVTTDDILIVQADVFLRGITPIESEFIAGKNRGDPGDWEDYLNFHQIHKYLDYFAAFSIGYYDTDNTKWIIASDKRPGWVNHFNWFGRNPWYQSRRTNMTVKYDESGGDFYELSEDDVADVDVSSLPSVTGVIDGRGDHTMNLKQYCNIPLFWVIKGQNLNISKLGVFCCSTTPAANHTFGPTSYANAPRNAIRSLQIRWGNSSLMAMKLRK